jgi:2-haloacid dehalogenase
MTTLLSRRHALAIAGATVAWAIRSPDARASGKRVEAIALDALTVFDPRSIIPAVEAAFGGKGAEFSSAWRTRQFEYCWLRTLNGHYADFWQVTGEALDYVAEAAQLELRGDERTKLMAAYLRLKPWPDSAQALKTMADAGIRLVYLSNMTEAMMRANTENAGLVGLFEQMLSTDAVMAYKPDARAYRMAETALQLPREKIVFAAFGGWDAAGAKSFGLDTFWVNRLGAPLERLGTRPDAIGVTLLDLAHYVTA